MGSQGIIEAAVRSDQKRVLNILQRRFSHVAYPHALLFVGQKGVGKGWSALALATAVCCPHNPNLNPEVCSPPDAEGLFGACGRCRSCQNAMASKHPDIHHVKPHKDTIKIDVIRDLLSQLTLKPLESERRVILLEAAETMTPSAANALLKILEEPPAGTLFVLTVVNQRQLLPTIRSRCQQVVFNDLSLNTLTCYAKETLGLSETLAATASALSFGSFERLQVRGHLSWLETRRRVIQNFISLGRATFAQRLAYAQQLAKDRLTFEAVLDILTTWFRDLMIHKCGIAQYMHQDLTDLIAPVAAQTPKKVLLDQLACVVDLRKKMRTNLNLKLAGEAVILKLTNNQTMAGIAV